MARPAIRADVCVNSRYDNQPFFFLPLYAFGLTGLHPAAVFFEVLQ